MTGLKRLIAVCALNSIYWAASFFSVCLSWRRAKVQSRRIIINGTFHNPNWFYAHIVPIVKSEFGDVILVCDEALDPVPGLTYRCPPVWLSSLLSRAVAKFVWTLIQGWKYPASIYVGYHIFPSAVTALVVSRLYGAKCMYQVTAGELELQGGGWNAENKLMTALGSPSNSVEHAAHKLLRQFDLVIVRGSSAKNYVIKQGFKGTIEVVTGSVETNAETAPEKDLDVIFVGRLAEYKRPDKVLEVAARVKARLPEVRFALVGDGPDRETLAEQHLKLGLGQNVEFLGQRSDVEYLLSRSKIFLLTSRWEGVSIAMLEAMAMQAVPVVSNVGDLSDFARNNETGFVYDEEDLDACVEKIVVLLENPIEMQRLSVAARALVVERCDRKVLASRWRAICEHLTSN